MNLQQCLDSFVVDAENVAVPLRPRLKLFERRIRMLEALHARLLRTPDVEEQRRLMRQFEQRAVSEMAHMGLTLWWYKINPHWAYVKGWKAGPSHYLNQHLDNVWLDR